MKLHLTVALALLAGASLRAADPIPLDVKTGQWETTMTTQTGGPGQSAQKAPAIPPEQLAKLPPEQRARVEAALKQAAGGARTGTAKNCVKSEDLAKMNPANNQNPSCKLTLIESSRTRQQIHMDCDNKGNTQTGTILVEALSSESIKFTLQMASVTNGQAMNMTVNGTSKWLGPTCSDAK